MTFAEQLEQRIEMSGDTSPGAWNLAADLLKLVVEEASRWTNRADDAVRIPDVINEAARVLRARAAEPEPSEDECLLMGYEGLAKLAGHDAEDSP